MKNKKSHRSIVLASAAALGAMTLLTSSAFAQQRVGGDGRINDASNRVGSGGFNDNSASALPPGLLGNAIVTGDITGGRGFRGNVPYFDPGAFHGTLAESFVSNFAAESTNVQTSGTIVNNAQDVHLFLGDSRGVNPPSNFVSTGAQPGYIPANIDSDAQFTSDTRLGTPAASVSSILPSSIFQTGGTQAGAGQSVYVTNSSLFGQKTLQTAQQTDGTFQPSSTLNNGPLQSAIGSGDRVDQSADLKVPTLSDSTATNPDLTGTNTTGGLTAGSTPGAPGTTPGMTPGLGTPPGLSTFGSPRATSPNASSNQPSNPNANNGSGNMSANSIAGGTPYGGASGNTNPNGPINASISNQIGGNAIRGGVPAGYPLDSRIGAMPLTGSLNTGEEISTNIYSRTTPWNQPGSNYQQMVRRLNALNPNAPLTPIERNLLNQAKIQDLKAADSTANPKPGESRTATPQTARPGASDVAPGQLPGSGQPGVGQPGVMPAAPTIPQSAPPPDKAKPIQLNTFTNDEASPAIREHLSKAEDLMKQGKFTTALEEYDLVEQQAPSQPYIQLARANAELGASYYGLAEAHLRQAFMSDQALLSSQLDLHTFLGPDKLQYLVKDLKQIAEANPTESRPVFLLAYICYNTNNPRGAAAYLALAEKREGKPDPFFIMLHRNWDLPDIGSEKNDTGLNK